jgi:cobaltochelatase CobN
MAVTRYRVKPMTRRQPPPHNYMATYFWLEKSFQANAVVHFGTHGSEFALPGKANGLARRDWPDILMGSMPNFNPWIIENMVESSPVKRRVYGTLISHLPPPIVDAGLSDGLEVLHETIDKWDILEEGALKTSFRKELTKLIIENRLDKDLKLTIEPEQDATDEVIRQVSKYLHDIQEETTPISLHLYGEPREKICWFLIWSRSCVALSCMNWSICWALRIIMNMTQPENIPTTRMKTRTMFAPRRRRLCI